MREIKFRVWNTKKKEYFIQEDDQRLDLALEYWELNKHVAFPEQFTGEKDKLGNDVYEGDIISVPSRRYEKNGIWTDGNSVVYFESGMFKCNNISLCSYSDYEVISNVHLMQEPVK